MTRRAVSQAYAKRKPPRINSNREDQASIAAWWHEKHGQSEPTELLEAAIHGLQVVRTDFVSGHSDRLASDDLIGEALIRLFVFGEGTKRQLLRNLDMQMSIKRSGNRTGLGDR